MIINFFKYFKIYASLMFFKRFLKSQVVFSLWLYNHTVMIRLQIYYALSNYISIMKQASSTDKSFF